MEMMSFDAQGEVIHMYKSTQHHDVIPLFTITHADADEDRKHHMLLAEAFQALFGEIHPMELLTSTAEDSCEHVCESQDHTQFLQRFLRRKLTHAFAGTTADRFECHVNCARVTIGGFGGTWHHDATSQLTTGDGAICEYLALYYLHESSQTETYPWLECALVTENDPDRVDDEEKELGVSPLLLTRFCPVSTAEGQVLVLRNDWMMHRTPVLCNLVPGGSVRRFFYIPFRALDSDGAPVLLVPPEPAHWEPYQETLIQERIMDELEKHKVDMDLTDYIVKGIASITLPWSDEQLSSRPNWLFEDPDDY
jgi:hypothetical protein